MVETPIHGADHKKFYSSLYIRVRSRNIFDRKNLPYSILPKEFHGDAHQLLTLNYTWET